MFDDNLLARGDYNRLRTKVAVAKIDQGSKMNIIALEGRTKSGERFAFGNKRSRWRFLVQITHFERMQMFNTSAMKTAELARLAQHWNFAGQ